MCDTKLIVFKKLYIDYQRLVSLSSWLFSKVFISWNMYLCYHELKKTTTVFLSIENNVFLTYSRVS